ncbi:MAG TPA: transcription antitermination factor NusB [Sphingobacteriaceae bacterium]|nr:transcription antitermination factor NusB [Sphingobacteriaceae bacterium]
MLNRRHLRVKVVQVLYAYQQSETKDITHFEKALLQSVDKVYEMYIWMLSLLIEVADYSVANAEERANKLLPSEDDKNASTQLEQNTFIRMLRENAQYKAAGQKYRVSWSFDPEIARNIFTSLKTTSEYQEYIKAHDTAISAEKDIIKFIFKKVILKSPIVDQVFEEKFINWQVDKEVLQAMIAKTFKNFASENPLSNKLAQLTPEWEEDREFIIDLLNRAVAFDSEYQDYIAQKTKNWEADRIAMMDTLLMKMAITELVHFPSIPVKVTINEYIELAKEFSTPKSNSFINGILDKILADLKKSGKVNKTGRGLNTT